MWVCLVFKFGIERYFGFVDSCVGRVLRFILWSLCYSYGERKRVVMWVVNLDVCWWEFVRCVGLVFGLCGLLVVVFGV